MTATARKGYRTAAVQARVMTRLQKMGWTLREIGDVWGVGRLFVNWLIQLQHRSLAA